MGISGNSTGAMLARFHTDVVPLKPDLVIISTSFVNGGLHNQSSDASEQYQLSLDKKNIMKMVDICKTIGADYMILGGAPSITPTTYGQKGMEMLNSWYREQFGDKYIDIYNSLGSRVKSFRDVKTQNGVASLDLSSLPTGIYFLNILSSDIRISKKIVIER